MKYMMLLSIVVWSNMAWAGQVNIPNTFTAGTKAKASEVNANFSAVKQAVDDNAAKISTNTADIYTNTSNIAAVQSTSASNTSSVASLQTAVSNNATKISTNTTDIYANASAISSLQASVVNNSGNIQNNASGVLGNAANIGNNTTAIASNSAAIANLQASIPATYQVVDSYGSILGDLLGITSGEVTSMSAQGYMLFASNYASAAGSLTFGGVYTQFQIMWWDERASILGVTPISSIDVYTSADCTGTPAIPAGGYSHTYSPNSHVFQGVTGLEYFTLNPTVVTTVVNSFSTQNIVVGQVTCVTPATVHPQSALIPVGYPAQLTNPLPVTFTEYLSQPNDPAITGIPNTIGFPLHIQKK